MIRTRVACSIAALVYMSSESDGVGTTSKISALLRPQNSKLLFMELRVSVAMGKRLGRQREAALDVWLRCSEQCGNALESVVGEYLKAVFETSSWKGELHVGRIATLAGDGNR